MEQRTHALRAHLGRLLLRRRDLRAVRGAIVLAAAEDQRWPTRLLLLLRRNRLQRWRDWLLHQLVLYPLRRVQKVRVDLAVVVGRARRADAHQLAHVADLFVWMKVDVAAVGGDVVGWMMWQFGLGVGRRRVRNELEVVEVLGKCGEAAHVVVDLINLVVLGGSDLTIRRRFLLLLHVGRARRVLQHVTVRQETWKATRKKLREKAQSSPKAPLTVLDHDAVLLAVLLAELQIDDLQAVHDVVLQQPIGLVDEALVLRKVLQLLHVLGEHQLELGVERNGDQFDVFLQGQREDVVLHLNAAEQSEFWHKS